MALTLPNTIRTWGHALTEIPEQEEYDLQDDGIHFELSFQLF